MRKRNHRVVFYLNDKEFEAFEKKAKRTSRSREAFIRKAIQEVPIKELPPADLSKRNYYKSTQKSMALATPAIMWMMAIPAPTLIAPDFKNC